jgi:hypothetical protein
MTTPTKTEKTFDCIEFKRHAQLKIYEQIRGMTHEQEQAYFTQQSEKGPLADWWRRVKKPEKLESNRNTLHKKLKEYGLEK